MLEHGFVRVAAGVPRVRVADCAYNADAFLESHASARRRRRRPCWSFPELCLTGYTCGDLFHQPVLQRPPCTPWNIWFNRA